MNIKRFFKVSLAGCAMVMATLNCQAMDNLQQQRYHIDHPVAYLNNQAQAKLSELEDNIKHTFTNRNLRHKLITTIRAMKEEIKNKDFTKQNELHLRGHEDVVNPLTKIMEETCALVNPNLREQITVITDILNTQHKVVQALYSYKNQHPDE